MLSDGGNISLGTDHRPRGAKREAFGRAGLGEKGREFQLKSEPATTVVPPGVSLSDGLSEDEAVTMALWSNAAFQEALTEIGFTRADLIQAGQLSNPTLSVPFPYGPKQLEFTVKLPLEVLWIRPQRVARSG